MTLKEDIIASDDKPTEWVATPEWPTAKGVYVKTVSAAEREAWESSIQTDEEGKPVMIGARCRFLVKCLVDEAGDRIFQDDESELLGEKSSRVIDRLWEVADRMNTVSGGIEELAGN